MTLQKNKNLVIRVVVQLGSSIRRKLHPEKRKRYPSIILALEQDAVLKLLFGNDGCHVFSFLFLFKQVPASSSSGTSMYLAFQCFFHKKIKQFRLHCGRYHCHCFASILISCELVEHGGSQVRPGGIRAFEMPFTLLVVSHRWCLKKARWPHN